MRRTTADWLAIVDEFRASGLTQTTFCKQRGIQQPTLSNWLKKTRSQVEIQPSSAGFVELDVLSSVARRVRDGREADLVVELPLGVTLRFHGVRK